MVLTREEVRQVLARLSGAVWLMASLLYGSGLRLSECLSLRVQDIDFERRELLVRAVHAADLRDGWGRVMLPDALVRKYPNASGEWRWQWVFPQAKRCRNAASGEQGRHHADESILQKAVHRAVVEAGLVKCATCHSSVIRSPRIFWKPATTSARCRNCWGTATCGRR